MRVRAGGPLQSGCDAHRRAGGRDERGVARVRAHGAVPRAQRVGHLRGHGGPRVCGQQGPQGGPAAAHLERGVRLEQPGRQQPRQQPLHRRGRRPRPRRRRHPPLEPPRPAHHRRLRGEHAALLATLTRCTCPALGPERAGVHNRDPARERT